MKCSCEMMERRKSVIKTRRRYARECVSLCCVSGGLKCVGCERVHV